MTPRETRLLNYAITFLLANNDGYPAEDLETTSDELSVGLTLLANKVLGGK